MPSQRTLVRRIQRQRVVAHSPNSSSTSVASNIPDVLKTTIREETFYAVDSGEEEPNLFITFKQGKT